MILNSSHADQFLAEHALYIPGAFERVHITDLKLAMGTDESSWAESAWRAGSMHDTEPLRSDVRSVNISHHALGVFVTGYAELNAFLLEKTRDSIVFDSGRIGVEAPTIGYVNRYAIGGGKGGHTDVSPSHRATIMVVALDDGHEFEITGKSGNVYRFLGKKAMKAGDVVVMPTPDIFHVQAIVNYESYMPLHRVPERTSGTIYDNSLVLLKSV